MVSSQQISLCHLASIVLGVLLIVYQCQGRMIKVRTNTLRDFRSLKCDGEFDKREYMVLTRICDDCYNLSRDPSDFLGCRANCFRNELFPVCVEALKTGRLQEEFDKKVALLNGNA